MIVEIPIYTKLLKVKKTTEELRDFLADYYKNEKFVKVMPFKEEEKEGGALFSDAKSGWDGIEIFVTGNDERALIMTRFDNLGKGASGAAVQCLNIVLGCSEDKGLNL